MSRSLKEWLAARDQWRRERALKIDSIEYPDKNSIVYERASNNPFWELRREYAQNNLTFTSLQFTAEDTFNFIEKVAQQERAKEEAFLSKFFPKNELRAGDTLTDQFNILFQSRERYERLLQRIETAKTMAKNGWKGMAPNMDALYASYLNQTLNKALQEFRAKFTINDDLTVLTARYNQLIDEAIIQATNEVAAVTEESEVYGSGKDWKEIAQVLNSDQYLKEQFIKNMRSVIGADNLQKVLTDMMTQKQKGQKKEKVSTILRKNLNLSQRTAGIGGNVIENTAAALAKYLGQVRGSNGSISYSVDGTAVGGQMAVTDSILIFSADTQIDISAAVQKLNEELSSNSGYLASAYDKMTSFYESQKEKMDELYTVFINSKNYQLGGGHGTYEQHVSGLLSELDDFLERANVHVNIVDDFLLSAYNTAQGAVFAGQRGEIEEGIVEALKAAAVNFMFDDWQTLGTGTGNGIHMFLLSGKYVPSSEIFFAMANAGNSAVRAKASVDIPEIDDIGPDGYEGDTDVEIKQAISKKWKEEYLRISSNARWTADFVINVKQAISL